HRPFYPRCLPPRVDRPDRARGRSARARPARRSGVGSLRADTSYGAGRTLECPLSHQSADLAMKYLRSFLEAKTRAETGIGVTDKTDRTGFVGFVGQGIAHAGTRFPGASTLASTAQLIERIFPGARLVSVRSPGAALDEPRTGPATPTAQYEFGLCEICHQPAGIILVEPVCGRHRWCQPCWAAGGQDATLIDSCVWAELDRIWPEAARLGWTREEIFGATFWPIEARGLAALLSPGDRILSISATIITIEKADVHRTLLQLRRSGAQSK